MVSDIAVQCRGVQKAFGNGGGKVLALRGVDLDVSYGAMTLLVGPSGCGKTTLLSVIAGLLNTTGGEVTVPGIQPSAGVDCSREWRLAFACGRSLQT